MLFANSIFEFFFFIYSNMFKWGGNTLNNDLSIDMAKKELQKAIINELCKKGVIDFCQCNSIVKKLDEDIRKLENSPQKRENNGNMVVKIPL